MFTYTIHVTPLSSLQCVCGGARARACTYVSVSVCVRVCRYVSVLLCVRACVYACVCMYVLGVKKNFCYFSS